MYKKMYVYLQANDINNIMTVTNITDFWDPKN